MLHFYVCPKFACCSCVHYGQEACLHILPSILDFLWRELFSDFPSFYGLLPLGLHFVWLWAFLHLARSFTLFCSLAFPAVSFYYSYCDVIWPKPTGPFGFSAYSSLNDSVWSLGFLLHYFRAPVSYLFPPGHPWPIYFPWASSVLSNFVFPWAFTNSFGLPRPNYFILHPWGAWTFHQPLTFFTCITSGLL